LPSYASALSSYSSQDERTQETPVEMFNKDLRMFEESVQAAETHKSLTVFKTLRIPLVSCDTNLMCTVVYFVVYVYVSVCV